MAYFKKKKKKRQKYKDQPEVLRVRLPRESEVLGIVEVRLGYGKSRVVCTDGKTRLCRVPGHLRRALWVRPNSIVLVKPWEIDGDKRGDIIYKYNNNQADWLKKKGYLKDLIEKEEF